MFGKTLPVRMGMHLCAQGLGNGDGIVLAATVDHHNLVGKLRTFNALRNATCLIHGEDGDAQGGLLGCHEAFQFNTPLKRPHMRASRRGL